MRKSPQLIHSFYQGSGQGNATCSAAVHQDRETPSANSSETTPLVVQLPLPPFGTRFSRHTRMESAATSPVLSPRRMQVQSFMPPPSESQTLRATAAPSTSLAAQALKRGTMQVPFSVSKPRDTAAKQSASNKQAMEGGDLELETLCRKALASCSNRIGSTPCVRAEWID